MNLRLRHFLRVRLVFGVKSSLCCWWGPSRGDFWLWRAVICGLIIAQLNFPPLLGLRKHTHSHTCMYTHFLCYTFSIFLLSLSQRILPSPFSSMRFPDVFPVFSVLGLILYSLQIRAAKGHQASSVWTLWPPPTPSLPFDMSNASGQRQVQRSIVHSSVRRTIGCS